MMDIMRLERFAYSPNGTFGYLIYGDMLLYTVERPWDNNAPFSSCIPEGAYEVERYDSPKFGDCFILKGETVGHFKGDNDRYGVLIHPANRASELAGCIAPGQDLSSSSWAVESSRNALADLSEAVGDGFYLHITQWKVHNETTH